MVETGLAHAGRDVSDPRAVSLSLAAVAGPRQRHHSLALSHPDSPTRHGARVPACRTAECQGDCADHMGWSVRGRDYYLCHLSLGCWTASSEDDLSPGVLHRADLLGAPAHVSPSAGP